jgi:hypothetical protein
MNKMDASIKSLTITGTAAEDATRSRRPVGSRKKRSAKQEDEEFLDKVKEFSAKPDSQVKPETQVKAEPVAKPEASQIIKIDTSQKVELKPPVIHAQTQIQPQQKTVLLEKAQEKPEPKPEPVHDGSPRVILKPAKTSRVKLQPKGLNQVALVSNNLPHTRKARKFRLSVSSLNHRFTRAKRVKDETEKKSMPSIREYLIKKGVIQEKSKAPERMLRSMYRDFMLLKDTAL